MEWTKELEALVKAEPNFYLDHCTKAYVRFVPKEWNAVPELNKGQGWTPTNRILLFEFRNSAPETLSLHLVIGPSTAEGQETRKKIFDAGKANSKVLGGASKTLYPKWTSIWTHVFLTPKDFEMASEQDRVEKVQREWKRFLTEELPAQVAAVTAAFRS